MAITVHFQLSCETRLQLASMDKTHQFPKHGFPTKTQHGNASVEILEFMNLSICHMESFGSYVFQFGIRVQDSRQLSPGTKSRVCRQAFRVGLGWVMIHFTASDKLQEMLETLETTRQGADI